MKIKNKFKVNKKLWSKFKTEAARKTFNDVMEQSLKNQEITTHPDTKPMKKEEWKTICWNMACYAAWSVRDEKLKKGAIVIDIKNGKVVKRRVAK